MGCYLAIMGFQREMICIEKMDLRIRHALRSGRLYRSIREKGFYRVLTHAPCTQSQLSDSNTREIAKGTAECRST
jgi:hypothetical protein